MEDRYAGALGFAILVVIFVVIVYYIDRYHPGWTHLERWKAYYVENPDQIYGRSDGRYDEAAALALRRTESAPAPTLADHHRAATIIYRNVISQEHRPRAGADGTPPADDRELSALRQEMFDRARDHHMAALAALTDKTIAQDEAARAVERYGLPPSAEASGDGPDVGTVIDAALEFAHAGRATLLNNDAILAAYHAGEERGVDAELARAARDRRAMSVHTRQAAAAEAAEGRGGGARAAAYLDLSRRHTSDPQNSHDPSVNAAKKAIVARLRAGQGPSGALATLDQIAAAVRGGGDDFSRDPRTGAARPVLTDKAVAVVRRAHNGERSSSATATDEEVLRRVWARADDPQNAPRRAQMRQATFDALVDSWERGIGGDKIQCVDGRIGRMLGSLAWLDHDERNWDLRRLEQHKNEIFAEAARIIRAAAEAAAEQTADPALRRVGLSYLAVTRAELARAGDVDEAKERAWAAETRARIGRMVDARASALDRAAPGTVPKYAVEGIKREACSAL